MSKLRKKAWILIFGRPDYLFSSVVNIIYSYYLLFVLLLIMNSSFPLFNLLHAKDYLVVVTQDFMLAMATIRLSQYGFGPTNMTGFSILDRKQWSGCRNLSLTLCHEITSFWDLGLQPTEEMVVVRASENSCMGSTRTLTQRVSCYIKIQLWGIHTVMKMLTFQKPMQIVSCFIRLQPLAVNLCPHHVPKLI